MKKLDLKFYGIEKPKCKVVLKYKEHEYTSQELPGLDPTWEEEFIFCVDDPENDKISAVFYMCDQKLGDEQHFALNKLLQKKQTFKGLVVPGGGAISCSPRSTLAKNRRRKRTTPSWISYERRAFNTPPRV